MIVATEGDDSSGDGAVVGYGGRPPDDGVGTRGDGRPPDDGVDLKDSGRPSDDSDASRDGGGPPEGGAASRDGGSAGVLVASKDAIECIGLCGGSDGSSVVFFVMRG